MVDVNSLVGVVFSGLSALIVEDVVDEGDLIRMVAPRGMIRCVRLAGRQGLAGGPIQKPGTERMCARPGLRHPVAECEEVSVLGRP
jgi:hypothetical protein